MMCQHLQSLGCAEGGVLADGTPCSTWCEKTEAFGIPLGVQCILRSKTCEDARRCSRPRRFGQTAAYTGSIPNGHDGHAL